MDSVRQWGALWWAQGRASILSDVQSRGHGGEAALWESRSAKAASCPSTKSDMTIMTLLEHTWTSIQNGLRKPFVGIPLFYAYVYTFYIHRICCIQLLVYQYIWACKYFNWGFKRAVFEVQNAATRSASRSHLSGRKWAQVVSTCRQVAASGRKWPQVVL